MARESEYITRKHRIDARLKNSGWTLVHNRSGLDFSKLNAHAVEEYPTESGPADYALYVEGDLVGIIEAKKIEVATANVLEQAKRYARAVSNSKRSWNGYRVPFLYSTNGEQIHYLDVRDGKSLPRQLAAFHRPEALQDFLNSDNDWLSWLKSNSPDNPVLREYQANAIRNIENGIIDQKRAMLVAMATGTGKTFMAVNLIYRLIKSKMAKRILFLVDRKALAAQAAMAFAAFETPTGNKFPQEYEVFSQRFRKEDVEEATFDVSVLPTEYLTKPDASKTFVYVSTIQRMAINLLGKSAIWDDQDADDETDAETLDIPIHAFDVVIADECHRGYTSKETNVWRCVLEHFDAIKIGLTATPAAHTVAYFGNPIFRYTVEQAILEGYLVDYNAVKIHSEIRLNGVFLNEGEQVGSVDTDTGQLRIESLEDERQFDATQVEREITSPDSNRKIIAEFARYALTFEQERGRFPKTLIFASNDIQHISHADTIVHICKETFNRGDDFVMKITGNPNVDRPLEKLRRFRNRPEPKIVVTVDMLSTGVDIPALEHIVFLRPVKSRILWEQMLGRGTRRCDEINKDSFTIFDCFGGTLIQYFKDASNFKFESITSDPIPIAEIIRRIKDNEDREYNVKVLIKRMRRIDKNMSGEARKDFSRLIPDGDMGRYADALINNIRNHFSETMKLLNDTDFQDLLVHYKRAKPSFFVAYSTVDDVSSQIVFEDGDRYVQPEEYLKSFSEFVRKNQNRIDALKILLERPKDWRTSALRELRLWLLKNDYSETDLRNAHRIVYHKELADIISMIKHAIREEEPLFNADERVNAAMERVFKGKPMDSEQLNWVEYIKEFLIENLTIEEQDLKEAPIFERHGGLARFKRIFKGDFRTILGEINAAIAA